MNLRRILLGLVVLLSLMGFVPASAGAEVSPDQAQPDRRLSFGAERAVSMLTSAADNRLVVVFEARIAIYTLDTFDLVASHPISGELTRPNIVEGHVYLGFTEQASVREYRLSDGSETGEWSFGGSAVFSVSASRHYVWSLWRENPSDRNPQLCRLQRWDSFVECFGVMSEDEPEFVNIDIRQRRITFLGGAELGYFEHVVASGSHVGTHSFNGYRHEGGRIVHPRGADYSLWYLRGDYILNVDANSMYRTAISYVGVSEHSLLAAEPTHGDVAVATTPQNEIAVYRRGTAAPVTLIGHTTQSTQAIDLTMTENEAFYLGDWDDGFGVTAYRIRDGVQAPPPEAGLPIHKYNGASGLQSIGIQNPTGLEIVEELNRLVVAGDDQVSIYALDTLKRLAVHDDVYEVGELVVRDGSVFAMSAPRGKILRFDLLTGGLIESWDTEYPYATSFAVTDEHIWFAYKDRAYGGRLGRITRETSVLRVMYVGPGTVEHERLVLNPHDDNQLIAERPNFAILLSLDGDTEILDSWRSTDTILWGSKTDLILGWGAPVAVMGPNGSRLEYWTGAGISGPRSQFVTHPATAEFATMNGETVHLRDEYSEEPKAVFEVKGNGTKLALSDTFIAALSDDNGQTHLALWSKTWVEPDKQLTVSLLGHGDVTATSAPVEVSCGWLPTETVDVRYGSSVTLQLDPQINSCSINFRGKGEEVVMGDWDGASWRLERTRRFSFDLRDRTSILIVDEFLSPFTSINRFVEQTYVDLTGQSQPQRQIDHVANLISTGQISTADFVVYLTLEESDFELIEAPISRLYRAYFLRASDRAGQQYWVDQIGGGRSLVQISDFFSQSPEFQARYGSVSDDRFVDLVYENVMRRSPDAEGKAFWVDMLEGGLTRGELMTYFSDSPEFRTRSEADVFVTFVAGALEQSDLSLASHNQLTAIYRSGGPRAVASAVLNGGDYYRRFVPKPTVGLVANAVLDDVTNEQFAELEATVAIDLDSLAKVLALG